MKQLTRGLIAEMASRAARAPRRRAHHNLHDSESDVVQRFLVVALQDSHFRVHRHATRAELATVVSGRFDVFEFDDEGVLRNRQGFGDGCDGFAWETPPNTWHTLLPRSPVSAFLEVKQGPYDPATSAQFADWSPPEGHPAALQLQRWLTDARVGERAPVPPV